MDMDFHYYATYVAACLAGYTKEDATVIAHAAQYVDDSYPEKIKITCQDFEPVSTVLSLSQIVCWSAQYINMVYVPFHFLPANFQVDGISPKQYEGDPKYIKSDREQKEFELMCLSDSEIARDMIIDIQKNHLDKPYTLHLLGLRMHVLADTIAHQYFSGVSAYHVNDCGADVWVVNVNPEIKIYYSNFWSSGESYSPRSISDHSGVYTGHGRLGHINDYPWLAYRYYPQWRSKSLNINYVTRDNPVEFLKSFKQMYTALYRIKHYATDKKEFSFNDLIDPPYVQTVLGILSKKTEWGGNAGDRIVERCQNWRNEISKQSFGSRVQAPTEKEYSAESWATIAKTADPISATDYYKFNNGAVIHLNFVKTYLKSKNIDLETDDLHCESTNEIAGCSIPVTAGISNEGSDDINHICSDPVLQEKSFYISTDLGTYKFDLQTQKLIWHFPWDMVLETSTIYNIKASPLIQGTALYTACPEMDTAGRKGIVFCLDAATGKPRWNFRSEIDRGIIDAKMVISGDLLFVAIHPLVGNKTDCLFALNINAGTVRWTWQPGDILGDPVADKGIIVVAYKTKKASSENSSTMTCEAYYIGAVRAHDGQLLWTHRVPTPDFPRILITPVLTNNLVYYATEACDVFALDLETGTLKWQMNIKDLPHDFVWPYSMAVTSDHIYFYVCVSNTKSREEIRAYRLSDKKLTWMTADYSSGMWSAQPALIVSDGVIYTAMERNRNFKQTLIALDTDDNAKKRELWSIEGGTWVFASKPSVKNTLIAIANRESYEGSIGKEIYMTILWTDPSAQFNQTPDYGIAPLTVQFTDTSLLGEKSTSSWDFGDQSGPSLIKTPVHTYIHPGLYTVRQTVRWVLDKVFESTLIKENCITVFGISNVHFGGDARKITVWPVDSDYIAIGGAMGIRGPGKELKMFFGPVDRLPAAGWVQVTRIGGIRDNGELYTWGHDLIQNYTDKKYIAISSWSYWILVIYTDAGGIAHLSCIADANSKPPAAVTNLPAGTGWTRIAAGSDHALALQNDGTLTKWGGNDFGQIDPLQQDGKGLPSNIKYLDIAAGHYFSIGLSADGTIYATGIDTYGQVSERPSGSAFIAVAAGLNTAAALTSDGHIVVWGAPLPGVPVPTEGGYKQIVLGPDYLLALK